MFKSRFGLFSGVFLLVLGNAHSWPQRAAAVCVPPAPPGSECFGPFLNNPVGNAVLTLNGNMLEVSNLIDNRRTAARAPCTAPSSGDEIVFSDEDENDQAHTAGKQGHRIGLEDTVIPTDTTAFYTDLQAYWGISCATESHCPWATDDIPIGFSKVGTDIIACANFDVAPINCAQVLVEFRAGGGNEIITCPSGELFRVPNDETIILQEIVATATCPGQSNCSELEARQTAQLEYRFKNPVSITANATCTNNDGSNNLTFSAKFVLIKPDLDSCMLATCQACPSPADRASDGAFSRGGNTPPIRRIELLAAESSASNRAPVPGSFTIRSEAIGRIIPTVGTWALVVMVQLVLVAGTVVLRRRLPAIRTIGYGC